MSVPSQSEAIIASLIDEVQKSNTPFDVNVLIGGHEKKMYEESTSSKNESKGKRHKEKKSKKNKKSSSKRTQSGSPSEHKNRRHNRHRSSSIKHNNDNDEPRSGLPTATTTALSMEHKIEKVSDDEDDLPMGADFLTVGTNSPNSTSFDEFADRTLPSVMITGRNRRREFVPNEEFFPISKKVRKECDYSPPLERSKRPLSQILARVRTKKDSGAFVPRNIKLKQEIKHSVVNECHPEENDGVKWNKNNDGNITRTEACKEDTLNEEYGPRVVSAGVPSGPLPISDDDDEMQLSLAHPPIKSVGRVKIASLTKKVNERRSPLSVIGKNGEIPISEASGGISSSSDEQETTSQYEKHNNVSDSDHNKTSTKANREVGHYAGEDEEEALNSSSHHNKKDSKNRKKKKKKKHDKEKKEEKRKHLESVSSSSDSEKKWKIIENKSKAQFAHTSSAFGEYSRLYSDRYEETYDRNFETQWVNDNHKRRLPSYKSFGNDSSAPAVDRYRGRSHHHYRVSVQRGRSTYASNRYETKLVSTLRRPKKFRSSYSSSSKKYSRSRSKSKSASGSRSSSTRSSEQSQSRCNSSSRSRSPSRREYRHGKRLRRRHVDEKSDEHKIDKKKLLEIAQRNAAQMTQSGAVTSTDSNSRNAQTSGQSVDQLVDFCQKLQQSQEKDEKEHGKSGEPDDDEVPPFIKKRKSEEETDFVKHPFALKQSAPITINITNAVPLPIKTPAQRTIEETQLRICYPVSSGQQHRETDVVIGNAQSDKNASYHLPPPPPPPLLQPTGFDLNSVAESENDSCLLPFLGSLPPPPPPPQLNLCLSPPQTLIQNHPLPPPPLPQYNSLLFDHSPTILDKTPANVGKVLAKRVEAKKRLVSNPNDVEARDMLGEADDQMKAWAESKNVVGKFTGTTGVQILTAEQLAPNDPRYSAWAKKDLFKSANKVTGGVGHKLMEKMGWTPGEGLGKDGDGPLEPLSVDVKADRKGLVSTDELPPSKKSGVADAGKHPVSLLIEICSKKHWPPPQFSCDESGPTNNRRFMWKVIVNGVAYEPATASSNKKLGKAQVCEVALESLGFKQSN